ncbi:MAG: sensor histidine kinase [Alphaproteobacteria bacterium]|nr:sensor histidine kinase [Alphaproteobacteria bacterium]
MKGWLLVAVILSLCGWFAAPAGATPRPPLTLAGDAASFPLDDPHLSVLEDETGSLGVDQLAGADWREGTRRGLASGTVWYRFTAVRAPGMPAEWTLAFGEPDIDDVRVFVPDQGVEIRLGRRIPSERLPLAGLRHVATLTLPEGKPVTVHIRLASRHKIRFEDAALWRPGALMFEEVRESALFGIEFGVLAVIVTVHALFGAWLRDAAMLLYALYVGTTLCRGLTHSGIAAVVFPSSGGAVNYMLSGVGLLGGIAAFIFLWDNILGLRRAFPVMHRIYVVTGTVVALGLFSLMSPAFPLFVGPALAAMFLASLASTALAALLVWRDPKDVLLKFHLFAFLPVMLGWGVEVAAKLTAMIPDDMGRQINVAATMTHIAILSVAMAYRLGRMQREGMRAEINLAGERMARQRLRTFIDMATHEFKTPLAVIDSAAQVVGLFNGARHPEIADRVTTIRRAVKRLVSLIETCLASERDETMAAKLRPVAPAMIVQQAAERNREPNRIEVTIEASGLPESCFADAGLLGIALDALIDNARRYGPEGQIIEIAARGGDGRITFSVEDRGPGIPDDEAAFIFDKYYRCVGGAGTGTGVGLHLVKTIAELHAGQASYRPREGGGASFALTIPAPP